MNSGMILKEFSFYEVYFKVVLDINISLMVMVSNSRDKISHRFMRGCKCLKQTFSGLFPRRFCVCSVFVVNLLMSEVGCGCKPSS